MENSKTTTATPSSSSSSMLFTAIYASARPIPASPVHTHHQVHSFTLPELLKLKLALSYAGTSPLPLDTPAMRSRRTSAGARRLVGNTRPPSTFLAFLEDACSRWLRHWFYEFHRMECGGLGVGTGARYEDLSAVQASATALTTPPPNAARRGPGNTTSTLRRQRSATQQQAAKPDKLPPNRSTSTVYGSSNHLPPVSETDESDIMTSPLGRLAALAPSRAFSSHDPAGRAWVGISAAVMGAAAGPGRWCTACVRGYLPGGGPGPWHLAIVWHVTVGTAA
ncbi:hypothetical protein C8Q70DRAFT_935700 [Cubamyces menziesii]|nr:hypothetical protein C8Q70DRAFT_935700 [Cubamyces menziesii]